MALRVVWRDRPELMKAIQPSRRAQDALFDAVYPVTAPPFSEMCDAIPGEVTRIRSRILVPPENNREI
jgi:hypothetical protein